MTVILKDQSKVSYFAAALVALGFATLTCVSTFDPERATLEAFASSVQASATAGAVLEMQSGLVQETVQAEATRVDQQMVATQAAQRTLGGAEQAGTAQAFQAFLPELGRYGLDPSRGRPAWIQPAVTLEVDGYVKYDYGQPALSTVAQDFLASVEITWDTEFTKSGCGLALRTNGIAEAPSQYLVIATRDAVGHILVHSMADGRVVNSYDLYAYGFDPAYNTENRATNRLAVVMIGSEIRVYTNGSFLGSVVVGERPQAPVLPDQPEPPSEPASPEALAAYEAALEQFNRFSARILADHRNRLLEYEPPATTLDRGFVALAALNDTGSTRCMFENAWLWLIE